MTIPSEDYNPAFAQEIESTMVPSGLSNLMQRHGILVAVIRRLHLGEKQVLGDRMKLDSDYSIRTLFDDLSVQEVHEFLADQILPRMSQQGRVCGVRCKPDPRTVVGLYSHDERDVVQRYEFSRKISAEVAELWSSSHVV